jgi:hypothetical protein
MPAHAAGSPNGAAGTPAGADATRDGAAGTPDGVTGGPARPDRDRKWPWPARLLVTAALLPVGAAVILAAENDFDFIGTWFDPLMIAIMLATVIAAWAATARSQR